jgi:ceramide glucosyltransferase
MIYPSYVFALFFIIFWFAMWLLHLIAIFYGKYRLHNKVGNLPPDEPCRGVSILKPLMGVDNNLLTNLETFFTMNYPIVSCIMFLLCLQAVTTISYSMNSCFV